MGWMGDFASEWRFPWLLEGIGAERAFSGTARLMVGAAAGGLRREVSPGGDGRGTVEVILY